jgi:tRNA nucleotidyltransferase/poly(A) polymerase
MKLPVPPETLKLCSDLRATGHEAYLVGGCVRDMLLGREPKDWDITTDATPEEIQALFPETFYENTYGTVGVVTEAQDPRLKVIEVTPYRTESTYSNARHPDEVRWARTLDEDLERRDFTMNAIAYDPASETLIDRHDGVGDISRRTITAVGNPAARFAEDALRMLRAVRFAAELDFTVEANTMTGIAVQSEQLARISRERVRDELIRILMSDRPMQALFIAQKLGLLKHIVPALEEGIGCDQNHELDLTLVLVSHDIDVIANEATELACINQTLV